MAFKNGLNRKEQIQCAKWLSEGIPERLVAKKLHVSEGLVLKFTQEKLDAATKKAKEREQQLKKAAEERQREAATLRAALAQGAQDPGFS